MNETFKHGVAGIFLAFTLAAAYIFERKFNSLCLEGYNRDEKLSFLEQRHENLEVRFNDLIGNLDKELSFLKQRIVELVKDIKSSKNICSVFPRSCGDILKNDPDVKGKDGVYEIFVNYHMRSVYCDMSTDGGGWTVIQRRTDGSTDFYRTWIDYKEGFGDPSKEFWIGNDAIHDLTKTTKRELRVDLQSFDGAKAYALYSRFQVGDEISKYKLSVEGYSGTAGNSLAKHDGMKFSTHDHDNDKYDRASCAESWHGAWWYHSCHNSNLNGEYAKSALGGGRYPIWNDWEEFEALKGTRMMIK